jgi:ribosomal protein S18 acetylase RimI-like enzyme
MPDDLARAFAFIASADMAGSRTQRFRYGTAVFMPELPLRYDSNYLLADRLTPDVDAAALAAEADRLQGTAGLGHRTIMLHDPHAADRLAAGFAALGWGESRFVVMAQRREPERAVDTALAAETDEETLYAAREAHLLGYQWATREVVGQLLAARRLIPTQTRHFAVFVGGEPASWAELYLEGDVGQIEAVVTAEQHRNRGYASAVVLRAAQEARAAGADLVFLVADADDWPRQLYQRLGFDELGRYAKFTRVD